MPTKIAKIWRATPEQRVRYKRDRAELQAARFAAGLCIWCGKREIDDDFMFREVKTCRACREERGAHVKPQKATSFCVECQAHDFHRDDCPVHGFNVALKRALDRETWGMLEEECPSPHRLGDTTRGATQALEGDHQPAAVEVGRSFDEGLPESGPAEIEIPLPPGTTYTTLPVTKELPTATGAEPSITG